MREYTRISERFCDKYRLGIYLLPAVCVRVSLLCGPFHQYYLQLDLAHQVA